MPLLAVRPRRVAEIPTSSMADIAFLLLIFFLVTTTIDVDTGIGMVLPPALDTPPPELHDRNMLSVLVNAEGQLLVEQQPLAVDALRATVQQHVMNCSAGYACLPQYAVRPDKAVVSLKTDRATPYDAYIGVLDEVWMGYRVVWDAEARRRGFPDYAAYRMALPVGEADAIRTAFKPQISIAEPDTE